MKSQKVWATPGTIEHQVANQTLTFVDQADGQDIFSDLGLENLMALYNERLKHTLRARANEALETAQSLTVAWLN